MSVKTVKKDGLYTHPEHGAVLVRGIVTFQETWPDSKSSTPVVQFYDHFDDYGGMPPILEEEVEGFAQRVDYLGEHEYISPGPSDLT